MTKEIVFPNLPKVILEEKNRGGFEISPLYPGYGITLGNALRRVLLSSLPGCAITKVEIKDVPHEFSSIKGVLEDTIDILLNLKKIRIKMEGDEPKTLTLKAEGKKEVYGKDIETPAGCEIVNKDQLIATLTDNNAKLEMNLTVEKGIGFSLAEEREKEKAPVGTIFLDAIFSPVRNVSFEVENIRYQERTDYNLLRIFIETDGTITPKSALKQASQILINHFSVFTNEAF